MRHTVTIQCEIFAKDNEQAVYNAEYLQKKINLIEEIDVNNAEILKIERNEFGSLERVQIYPEILTKK